MTTVQPIIATPDLPRQQVVHLHDPNGNLVNLIQELGKGDRAG
ncbi:hypothetical protein [Plantactinospora sp. DSM 117369]